MRTLIAALARAQSDFVQFVASERNRSVTDDGGAPGEAAAHRLEHDADRPCLIRPSRTAASSASGTEAAEVLACWSTVTITLRRIEAELPRGGVEDALVGLVRHHPVDLVGLVAGGLEHLAEHVGEVDDRVAEHLLALHPQLADRAGGRDAAVDIEQVVVAAVGVEPGGEDARDRSASSAFSTTAPAPSPNRTQVVRSSQSRIRLNVSEPITSA